MPHSNSEQSPAFKAWGVVKIHELDSYQVQFPQAKRRKSSSQAAASTRPSTYWPCFESASTRLLQFIKPTNSVFSPVTQHS